MLIPCWVILVGSLEETKNVSKVQMRRDDTSGKAWRCHSGVEQLRMYQLSVVYMELKDSTLIVLPSSIKNLGTPFSWNLSDKRLIAWGSFFLVLKILSSVFHGSFPPESFGHTQYIIGETYFINEKIFNLTLVIFLHLFIESSHCISVQIIFVKV